MTPASAINATLEALHIGRDVREHAAQLFASGALTSAEGIELANAIRDALGGRDDSSAERLRVFATALENQPGDNDNDADRLATSRSADIVRDRLPTTSETVTLLAEILKDGTDAEADAHHLAGITLNIVEPHQLVDVIERIWKRGRAQRRRDPRFAERAHEFCDALACETLKRFVAH